MSDQYFGPSGLCRSGATASLVGNIGGNERKGQTEQLAMAEVSTMDAGGMILKYLSYALPGELLTGL